MNIRTTQFKYEDGMAKILTNNALQGQISYTAEDLVELKYDFWNENNPQKQVINNLDAKHVTKIQCLLKSNLHHFSPYARYLERYNRGVSEVTFELRGVKYPDNYHVLGKCNSTNTFGPENSSFFFQEYKKGIKRQKESEYGVNQFNYSININTNSIAAVWDILMRNNGISAAEKARLFRTTPCNIEYANWTKILGNNVYDRDFYDARVLKRDQVVNDADKVKKTKISAKTIYALHFESITSNESSNMKETALELVYPDPFSLMLQRIPNYNVDDYYHIFGQTVPIMVRTFLTKRHEIKLEGNAYGTGSFNIHKSL
jgi:hypothetical protein